MKFLESIMARIANEESIPPRHWIRAQQLAASVVDERRLYVGPQALLVPEIPKDFTANELDYPVHTIAFRPLYRSGRPILTKEQKPLSSGFLSYGALLAHQLLKVLNVTHKEGRIPFGKCAFCGDYFLMATRGKKQRFCGRQCKSLERSKKGS
jgi:hypothetical protein